MALDRVGDLTADQFSREIAASMAPPVADELAGTFQPLDATLTDLAGRNIGAAAANDILDRAAGDARYVEDTEKGAASGVATLDVGGKVPFAQIPLIAITDIYVVASEAAQLALIAEEGDIAVRTDLNRSYARNSGSAGTMADWTELLTPTDAVLSVAGKTGAVTLAKADVGLGNVDNTSDANKPISTATATALAAKAPLASPTFTGIVTTAGQIAFPAVENASADPNTLDDYEEGTFTPGVTFGGGSTGMTFSTQTGRYTKIGRVVFFEMVIVMTAKGSSTGTAVITGMPFTSAAIPNPPYSIFCTGMAALTVPIARAPASGTTTNLFNFTGANTVTMQDTNFTNTSAFAIGGHFTV